MISLGIDIGGTSIKSALLRDNQIVSTHQSAPYTKPTTELLIQAIRETIPPNIAPDTLALYCPGLLDRPTRTITLAVNVPGLMGLSLDDLLSHALGPSIPRAEILSDASATAFDLYTTNSLTGRLLSLTLGTGVGAAVIDNGHLLQVTGETPGHFGQIDVSLDADPSIGPDGGAGSLEGYVGARALNARYGENAIEHMNASDPPICALVRAIRIAHAIYRPNHIGLAGGVGIRLGQLLPEIKSAVERNLTTVARAGWSLFTGESDFHAACGAARFAARPFGVAGGFDAAGHGPQAGRLNGGD